MNVSDHLLAGKFHTKSMSKHKAFKKLTQRCDWSTESRDGGKTVGHEDEATSPIPSAWGGSEEHGCSTVDRKEKENFDYGMKFCV